MLNHLSPVVVPTTETLSTVPDGKIADFLTGQFFKDNPEEYVRQNIEKALVRQYRYEPSDCEPEFRIKVGSSTKRVDIAVFGPGASHRQENAFLLVETKKAGTNPHGKKDGIDQLKSYMAACLNAQYGMWTNGDDRYCFAKRTKNGNLLFEEVVEIPAQGQTEAEAQRPQRKDLKPATADNLLFAFRRCHNYIAGNAGLHKGDAFWELLKIIFAKIEDERSGAINFYATPSELSTAIAAGATKARIQRLFNDRVVKKYPNIFNTAETQTIELRPDVLAYVVAQLQGYSLLASPVDVKGIAYEEIVGANLRGDRGEFFTPRNACRMAVEMLDPQPGERVLDPACGTGGFLITAMNHGLMRLRESEQMMWVDPDRPTPSELQELFRKNSEYLSTCVYGLDINPSLVRAAKMNMVMNNDGEGGLFRANSLANPHRWDSVPPERVSLGSMDVIFTNPPFGANIVIDDELVLSQYALAAVWDEDDEGVWTKRTTPSGEPVLQSSQPPEVLFIERCVQLLKEGTGRMAMVIPNGILNNPALAYVRTWMLQNVQLLAVVDMHRDLFQPKNDTQTSMVLMRRLDARERDLACAGRLDYPVFMAIAEKIGHDKRGNLIYRHDSTGADVLVERVELEKTIDSETGQETERRVLTRDRVIDDDLPTVADSYREWVESKK